MPASIGILKSSLHKIAADKFVEFLLSPQGQELLLHKTIARLPIDPAACAASKLPLNPFSLKPANHAKTFDSRLSQQRYPLINLLFDHFMTFSLNDLKRIHGKLNRAQQRFDNDPGLGDRWHTGLQKARRMLTKMPLTEIESQNNQLLQQLRQIKQSSNISGFLPATLARRKQTWFEPCTMRKSS